MSNLSAFLDVIAWSEVGPALLAVSDDGYNVIVGSTATHPILFHDYSTHPNRLVHGSTAAGRYQELYRNWVAYKSLLNLPDFGKLSQDRIAIRQIEERQAFDDVVAGRFADAIHKCSNIWASFPGNNYGQHAHTLADLQNAYTQAGGTVC